MTGQTHMAIGGLVLISSLVIAIWAFWVRRHTGLTTQPLLIGFYVATGILALQVLIGLDLWFGKGLRPAPGVLGLVHFAGPLVALAWAIEVLVARRAKAAGAVAFSGALTFVLALLSYGIGQSAR